MLAMPTPAPITRPVEVTLATDGLLLVQKPPAGVAERDIVLPTHSALPPDMSAPAVTVIILEEVHPPTE